MIIAIFDHDDVGMNRVMRCFPPNAEVHAIVLADPDAPISIRVSPDGYRLTQGSEAVERRHFSDAQCVFFRRWRIGVSWPVQVASLKHEDQDFAHREWASALEFLLMLAEGDGRGKWANPVSGTTRHRNKLYLLIRAVRSGLPVPEYLVATNFERHEVDTGSWVTKGIGDDERIDDERYFFTTHVDDALLGHLVAGELLVPSYLQRRVLPTAELRVIVCCGSVLTVRQSAREDYEDIRTLETADLRVELAELGDDLSKALIRFCEVEGLGFCVFDVLENGNQHALVDVTPHGSWDYLESEDNPFISQWIARVLCTT